MKRLISLAVSGTILAILFYKVDRHQLMTYLSATRWHWFALALFMFVPQIALIAARWRRLVGVFAHVSWREAIEQILASNTMNLVLPSKMGDLAKGVFLQRMGRLDLGRALNVVIFEKMLDVATLAAIMLLGVILAVIRGDLTAQLLHAALLAAVLGACAVVTVGILYFVPPERIPGFVSLLQWLKGRPKLAKVERFVTAGHETISLLQERGAQRLLICFLSVAIWISHLAQIYFFFLALGATPLPVLQFITMVPLAIFIGLIPLTIAGFGTRDGALIALFPQFPPSLMLGVAMYVNLRYVIPALAGMPFLNKYLIYAKELASRSRDS